jgi:putative holliday junction resolvase
MAKLMAIDFGLKRTGIAVTDDFQIIASGLTTVDTKLIFKFLLDYTKTNKVECIVIGDPRSLANQPIEMTEHANSFALKLKTVLPNIQIERLDERYTSKMAFQTMIDGGLGKKARKNKALIDEISATILLQNFMAAYKRQ